MLRGGGWTKLASYALTSPTDSLQIPVPSGYDVLKYTILYFALNKRSGYTGSLFFRVDFIDPSKVYDFVDGSQVVNEFSSSSITTSQTSMPMNSSYNYLSLDLSRANYGCLSGYVIKSTLAFNYFAHNFSGQLTVSSKDGNVATDMNFLTSMSYCTLYSNSQNLQPDTMYIIEGMKL